MASTPAEIQLAIRERRARMVRRGQQLPVKQPRALFPLGPMREYERSINILFNETFDKIDRGLIPQLDSLLNEGNAQIRSDDMNDRLAVILSGILLDLGLNLDKFKTKMAESGYDVSDFNKNDMRRVWKTALALDILVRDSGVNVAVGAFISQNTALIRSLGDKHLQGVGQAVYIGWRQGQTAAEIGKAIEKLTGTTKNHAMFIARDQVSKLNGQLTGMRQQELGITRYRWRTARDERVRANHATKEGRIFLWTQPPSDTGHPGEDFNCRCYAEPVMEDLV